MQGRLFDPDNPPLAFSKEEGDAALEQIKEELRKTPGWYRHKTKTVRSVSKAVDYGTLFHDRREDS